MRRIVIFAVAVCLAPVGAAGTAQTLPAEALAEARQLVEERRCPEARELLDRLGERRPTAEVHLLSAYCHFFDGEVEAGRTDLDRSLALDPDSIDAWQLEGAVELDQGNYDAAVAAFRRLQQLEPTEAPAYDLNIGAALLLGGDLARASRHFNIYLRAHRDSWMAYFLVAKNYALAERWDLALQHLEAATRLDERARRQARRDANFVPMLEYEPFVTFLGTDTHRPGPGDHYRRQVFEESYDGGSGPLLAGVLNALQLSGARFDPAVEVTDGWALVWGEMRIKLSNAPEGGGQVELSAPSGAFSPDGWSERTDELLREIEQQLALLELHSR